MINPIRVIDAECQKHALKYKANVYFLFQMESVQPCPKCHFENIKAMERKSQVAQFEIVQAAKRERANTEMKDRQLKTCIPEKYQTRNFANYRVGTEGQKKALQKSIEFANNFKDYRVSGGSLIFTGLPGTGKTHLSCAIANQIIQHEFTAVFITVSEMIRAIRATYGTKDSEQDAIDRFANVDLLIMDEVGQQRGTRDEVNLVSEVVNKRVNAWRPNIVISNLDDSGMRGVLGERVWDRLSEGRSKLVDFNWESYRKHVKNDSDLPRGSV